jgi:elongation factor G
MAHEATAPERVRNVVLVGHTGGGKTTLVEALLAATGAISRPGSVQDGTTVTDFDEQARKQHRSVSVAVASCEHAGVKLNLIDTPGHPDYVGELRAGLRAADAALFVVSAVDGLDGATALLWDECASIGMPRAVVVTKLDSRGPTSRSRSRSASGCSARASSRCTCRCTTRAPPARTATRWSA